MELNKIYCGDAAEVLKDFNSNSIDCVITSPPYNVGKDYGVNDRRDYKEYLSFMEEVLKELYRVLKVGGRIAINLPSSILQSSNSRMAYLSIDFILIMRRIGFLDREMITWIKMPKGEIIGKSTSWGSWKSPSNAYLRDASEFIVIMDKISHKKPGKKDKIDITKDEFLKFTTNCWYFPPEHNRWHPAPFPEELPYRVIKLYTYVDDIILDPFCGIGTTLLVALQLKRKFIGIEINKRFVEMSKIRLRNSGKNLEFFEDYDV